MSDALSEFVAGTLREEIFNTAVVANTDILAAAITVTNPSTPAVFRIQACFDTGGVLTVRRTSGGITVDERLNGAVGLIADALYTFDIIVTENDTINLWYGVGATISSLKVVEIRGMM